MLFLFNRLFINVNTKTMDTTLLVLIVIACHLVVIIHQLNNIQKQMQNGTNNNPNTGNDNHNQRGDNSNKGLGSLKIKM